MPSIQVREISFAPDNIWRLHFYREFEPIGESVQGEVEAIVNGDFSHFVRQISIEGIPFLVAFFFDKREIRLYSPRLSWELCLWENLEAGALTPEFLEHVNAVLKLSQESFPSEYDLSTHWYRLPDLVKGAYSELDGEVKVLSEELLERMEAYRPSLFERFSDEMLRLAAKYDLLRIHLLKFIAILPSLEHDLSGGEIKRILLEHLRRLLEDNQERHTLPWYLSWSFRGVYAIAKVCPLKILGWGVRFFVQLSARRFIAGENISVAEESLRVLAHTGRGVTLDPLGELVVSEKEADHYRDKVLEFIVESARQLGGSKRNRAGINCAHVSIKVSALCSDFRAEAFESVCQRTIPRLREILLTAKRYGVFINIDAEHFDYRDLIFNIYRKVLLTTQELSDYADTGIVLQSYLRDGAKHLEDICQLAKERKMTMPIRLVKGAYWDVETIDADAHSWNAPEFLNKEESDLLYRQLVVKIFESWPHVQLCLAGHNFADHCFAEVLREKSYSRLPPIEHQCLHMTCESLSQGMVEMGWVVRNYIPIGPLLMGMAYLVRRILENSSQIGVLTLAHDHRKRKNFLSPVESYRMKREKGQWVRDLSQEYSSDFSNITPLRSYIKEEWSAFERELKDFSKFRVGSEYIGAFSLNGDMHTLYSPGDPELTVGRIRFGDVGDVAAVVAVVDKAYRCGEWAKAPVSYRVGLLLKVAHILLVERNRFASLIVHEAGKTALEALGDVDEAIDFLNYYARCALKMPTQARSRGCYGVISPWNFPLAIPCGMVAAPLVVGNTVILKSAEQTPLVAARLVELFHRAGVPQDVLVHLPGEGESVGAELVRQEALAGIVFTGSRTVGVRIIELAGSRVYQNKLYGDAYPVKVIAEMGGKNAIIVTDNAELDETVNGILMSAFGHAGQKCSAASRVIVHNNVKQRLLQRLQGAIEDLIVSSPFDFGCAINPVITLEDRNRLRRQVAEAVMEAEEHGGRVLVDRSREDFPGWCVGPVLIELTAERGMHSDSYARRELFGPVLHVIGVDSLDEALTVYNATEYGLTGGIFSQSQDDIDYLGRGMESGNIYVNRNITGARVAIEPFGGFKFSGTGPKAGHRSYLRAFYRNATEKITSGSGESIPEGDFTLCSPRGKRGDFEKILESMEDWIERPCREQFRKICSRQQNNRKIPGQLSYNDWSLNNSSVLLVSASEKYVSRAAVLQVVAAVSVGAGVSLACLNSSVYREWRSLSERFHSAGQSKNAINAFLTSEDIVRKHFLDKKLSVVVLEGEQKFLESMIKDIYSGMPKAGIKTVLTSVDVPVVPEELDSLLEKFVPVRSFAVNTVRYGAWFELNSL